MPTAMNWPFANLYIAPPSRRFRSLSVITPPVVEPVTLAEAKRHLRVEHEDEDEQIQGLIAAARQYAERRCDRHWIDTRLEMKLDQFPAAVEVLLPRPPFSPTAGRQAIEVEYLDSALGANVMTEALPGFVTSGSQFLANRRSEPAVITPNVNGYWPVVGPVRSAITIRWWAGYGDSPAAVPQGVRTAILMLVGHWYLNRESASPTNLTPVPHGVEQLLAMASWGAYS